MLGFASGKVYHAFQVTLKAVGSYPTFSPLPRGGLFSVTLSLTEDSVAGHYPVPCSMKPRLSSAIAAAALITLILLIHTPRPYLLPHQTHPLHFLHHVHHQIPHLHQDLQLYPLYHPVHFPTTHRLPLNH